MSEISGSGGPKPRGERSVDWSKEATQPSNFSSRADGAPANQFFRSGVSVVPIEHRPRANAPFGGSAPSEQGHEVIVARPDGSTARWSNCGDTAWKIVPGYQITEADHRCAKAASEKREYAEDQLAENGIIDRSTLDQPRDLRVQLQALHATDTGLAFCQLTDVVSAWLREMAEPATTANTRRLGALQVNCILDAVAQLPRRRLDSQGGDRFRAELTGELGRPPLRHWYDAMRAVIAQAERTPPGESG